MANAQFERDMLGSLKSHADVYQPNISIKYEKTTKLIKKILFKTTIKNPTCSCLQQNKITCHVHIERVKEPMQHETNDFFTQTTYRKSPCFQRGCNLIIQSPTFQYTGSPPKKTLQTLNLIKEFDETPVKTNDNVSAPASCIYSINPYYRYIASFKNSLSIFSGLAQQLVFYFIVQISQEAFKDSPTTP